MISGGRERDYCFFDSLSYFFTFPFEMTLRM